MTDSFLWYDLETFGQNCRKTRIAQFAAIRTDSSFNQLGEPISIFCKPANDLLPSPEATLITGITPQQALRDGLPEAEFFSLIHEQLSQPGTCTIGYNSIRFDDEFIRFGLYRNFYDPYEREWKNGNTRWDLLDFTRLVRAFRPEGIVWPNKDDGTASFKLEHLAQANSLREGMAHEALSDVRALIGLAKKLRTAQPRLWQYAFDQRDKRKAAALLDVPNMTPVLHISGMFAASHGCAALVAPLARHPRIDSQIIVVDLDADPQPLIDLSAEDIAERLYIRSIDLPEGEARIPLKSVHTNKCPVLLPLEHVREEDYLRLGLDHQRAHDHAERLRQAPGLAEKIRRIYALEKTREPADPDQALYDGFASDADKRLFTKVRSATPKSLALLETQFHEPRYQELLFRYLARNWPEALDHAQAQRWNTYRQKRLLSDNDLSELDLEHYYAEISRLRETSGIGEPQRLLDELQVWGEQIERDLSP